MIGHNNWFKINLAKGLQNHQLPFSVTLDITPCQWLSDFEHASDYTAKLIADTYENLYLCLSGGLDSEYVATVLLRNHIPFTPVMVVTHDNEGESWYARHFCKQHNLTPVVLDYREKYNELLKVIYIEARKICCSPTISFFPHVAALHIESTNGKLITGYGDPFAISNDYDMIIGTELEMEEHDFYLDVSFSKQHPGAFFSYTPDIFFSLVQSIDVGKNIQVAKTELYQLPPRSKITANLHFPDVIKEKVCIHKQTDLRCIKFNRAELLESARTKNHIKLHNK